VTPPRTPAARRSRRRSPAAWRVALYYVVAWSTIAFLTPRTPVAVAAVVIVAVATTIPLVTFFRHGGWRAYPTAAFRVLVVRPVLYTQLLLPLVSGAGIVGLLVGAPWGLSIMAGRIAAGAVFALMALLLGAGYIGAGWLVVRQVDATVPGLSVAWDGTRIAQISDLHVGPQTSRRFLARMADTVAALTPDLIAITGDLVDDQAEDVAHFAAAVESLHAPFGVYLIPGNHDVYAGWTEVNRRLRAALPGATVLVNDARILCRDGAELAIVGTGDPAGRRTGDVAPDVERTMETVPLGTTTIALAHNPALWPALAERGVALTLSGHTHWGQFALPRWGWSLASPFLDRAMGAYAAGDSLLYINPGTGYWGLPFRIGAHPEITLITLHRGAPAAIRVGRASADLPLRAAFAAD
jgi:uncharacterized protein